MARCVLGPTIPLVLLLGSVFFFLAAFEPRHTGLSFCRGFIGYAFGCELLLWLPASPLTRSPPPPSTCALFVTFFVTFFFFF